MSTERYRRDGLMINTYCGPEGCNSPNSNSRIMVQITSWDQHVQLTMDHWIDLLCFIHRMHGHGTSITSYMESWPEE